MIEYENSKSDDQLEELLLLTEQMQEELDQKDRTIEELKVQLDESLTLNERLNSENRAGNIQALKNDLRKTKELLQREKEKTHAAEIMTEECQDKLRQAKLLLDEKTACSLPDMFFRQRQLLQNLQQLLLVSIRPQRKCS